MGKFLSWLQERIRHWIKPATPTLICGLLSDLPRSRADLMVENAFLRQQLIVLNRQIKRPQLTHPDRFRLVFLAHLTKFWKQALHIVQPDTLLRWHRELFCFYWKRKSQCSDGPCATTVKFQRLSGGSASSISRRWNSSHVPKKLRLSSHTGCSIDTLRVGH